MDEAYVALKQFYNRFPRLRSVDLYLTGHAYAAVYQAYLAKRIIEHNEDPFEIIDGKINLKGLLFWEILVLWKMNAMLLEVKKNPSTITNINTNEHFSRLINGNCSLVHAL